MSKIVKKTKRLRVLLEPEKRGLEESLPGPFGHEGVFQILEEIVDDKGDAIQLRAVFAVRVFLVEFVIHIGVFDSEQDASCGFPPDVRRYFVVVFDHVSGIVFAGVDSLVASVDIHPNVIRDPVGKADPSAVAFHFIEISIGFHDDGVHVAKQVGISQCLAPPGLSGKCQVSRLFAAVLGGNDRDIPV